MRALLDVNMLLALFDQGHVHHGRALSWWRGAQEHGWASCPITQNGFLRIVSQSSYERSIPLADALAILGRWAQPPRHEFWADDVSLLDAEMIDHRHVLRPRQLTDIYLLALAVRHCGRLVTLDRGISTKAVKGASAEHLAVV